MSRAPVNDRHGCLVGARGTEAATASSDQTRPSRQAYANVCGTGDDYAFLSRVDRTGHLSTRQYARLVDERVTAIGLRRMEYGTHSLRRTKVAMIYRATGNSQAI